MAKYRRSPISNVDSQLISTLRHDILVNGERSSEVGHIVDMILGPLNSAFLVGAGTALRIWNNDTVTHFVKFGDAAITAPTSPANGIPVPAGQYIYLGSGENAYVRSDSAQVFGYRIFANSDFTILPD